jgi:hypothetical protein
MQRFGLWLAAAVPLVAASALGKLYHPEYIRANHGPALIDCANGFEAALRHYFEDDAKTDGLGVQGTPALTLATPQKPMSRFTARFATETFEGFVYIDPTMTEGESEPWEDEAQGDGKNRVCSATFVDGHATAAEKRQLELGWNTVVSRLYLENQVELSEVH